VVPEGVEPSTLALLAPHSNQLSYGTLLWLTAKFMAQWIYPQRLL
jgi:hypothetical protein